MSGRPAGQPNQRIEQTRALGSSTNEQHARMTVPITTLVMVPQAEESAPLFTALRPADVLAAWASADRGLASASS